MKSRNQLARWLAVSLLSAAGASSVMGAAITITVDSNTDSATGDATPGDGICGQSTPSVPPGGAPTPIAGTCTLRAAIQEANGNAGIDTIVLTELGAQARTITLTSDLPAITEPVVVEAKVTGAAVTLNGNNQFTALRFTPPASGADRSTGNSRITGLTITGAVNDLASGGGAIDFGPTFPSQLTLTDVVLSDNSSVAGTGPTAGPGGPGGAVAVSDGNALVIDGTSSLTGNRALRGGAIAVRSANNSPTGNVLTLSNVTASGNSATAGNGGAVLIDLDNGGNVTVTGGSFGATGTANRNSATGDGGAFWIRKTLVSSRISISGATLTNNGAANGGGVAVKLGRIQLSGSTLIGNAATAGAGGGLYLDAETANVSGGSAAIENVTFSGNSASTQGGAIAANGGNPAASSMIHSTLADNTAATGMGGGVSVANAPNLTFPGNFTDPFTSNIFANANNCRVAFSHADSRNSGYEIASDSSCGFTQASDRQGTNAQLAALAVNGPAGTVATRKLAATSPAIDAGNPDWATAKDARGADRQDAGVDGDYTNNSPGKRDIGAHEFGGFGIVEFKVSSAGYTVDEDASPAQALVARYGSGTAASSAPSVTLASSNGTATAGSDYTAVTTPDTTVSFASGNSMEVIRNIAITNDAVSEGAETFNLALSNPSGFADLGPRATATVTINDAENGTFQFSPLSTSATESEGGNNAANGSAVLTITRTVGSKGRVKVSYSTAADASCTGSCRPATVGDDYTAVTDGSVIFEAGETSKTIAIALTNNAIAETDERFAVNLTAVACVDAAGSAITGAACDAKRNDTASNLTNTVTIRDDDGAATFSIADVALDEGNSGSTKAFVFTVTLAPASSQATSVSAASANGSATLADGDYAQLAATTLSFAAGETSKTVTVNVTGDNRFEPDETFVVNLSNATGGAVIGDNQATGTIVNDEATPAQGSIGFVADCTAEAAKCATQAGAEAATLQTKTFAIRRSDTNATASTVSASITITSPNGYSTVGTAACSGSGNDYRLSGTGGGTSPNATTITVTANGTGTVTFNGNGTTEALINVEICNDTRRESLQYLNLALSNATGGAVLGTSSARLTTTSDEQPRYQMTRTAFSVREGADLFAVFNVQALDAVDGEQVCVPYKTTDGPANGGATSPADYSGVDTSADPCAGALVYANGNNDAKSFSAMIVDDGAAPAESNETFTGNLLTPVGGGTVVAGAETTTVTIVNQPRVYFSARTFTSADEADGSTLAFTLQREGDTSAASTVQYRIDTGSGAGMATFDTDFSHGSPASQTGSVSFAAGSSSATISTRLIGDGTIEGDERFTITLTGSDDATFPADSDQTPRTATGVIRDDDFRFELSAGAVTVDENVMGGNAVLTVNRVGTSLSAASVQFAVAAGTATAGDDYTVPQSTTVNFAAGTDGSQTISLPLVDDALDEVDETFTVTLDTPSAPGTLGTPSSSTVTITDDDAAPTIRIAGASRSEGDMAEQPLAFTITLSAASSKAVTVTATTANGTAASGSDYTSTTQMVMIPAGQTTASFEVPVQGDTLSEPDETFTVTLSNPSNATFAATADSSATGTIVNDDAAPTVTLALGAATLAENGGTSALTAVLNRAYGADVTVTLAYSGTAGAPADYATPATTVTIPAGQTVSNAVTLTAADDALDEAGETIVADIASNSAGFAKGTPAQVTATITDDDATPGLAVNDATVTEGNGGSRDASFTVSLSAASGRTVTVNYATANGTATSGSDYTAASGSLSFAPGEISKTVAVAVLGDTLPEATETFLLNLSSAVNAGLADASGTGTITNDDSAPSLSLADASLNEGSSGTASMTFTATLSSSSSQAVTVSYATSNGSATAGSDYTATSGTLTIPAGQTTGSFTVPVTADTVDEANESFTVTLSNPANATLSRAQASGTIVDDDTSPATASATDSRGRSLSFSTSAGGFEGLAGTAQPATAPTNVFYDNGFFTYTIVGLTNGGSATVTVTLPTGSSATSYVNCPSNCISGGTGSGQTVTVTLVDGGAGDADGVANGRIQVKAGAGARDVSTGGGGGGNGDGGGGSFGATLLLGLLALAGRRRRLA